VLPSTGAPRRAPIMSRLIPSLVTIGFTIGVSCASAPTDLSPAVSAVVSVSRPAPSTPSALSPSSSTRVAPSAPAATPAEPPRLGRDHRTAVACEADTDCGWDDPCSPQRCVEASPPGACDESTPPPGSCLCVEGACTLKPKKAALAGGPCEEGGCVVDRAGGTCVADTGGVPEGLRTNPGVTVGPSCDCIEPSEGCKFRWFESVPCRSDRDCWVDPSPRPHPTARPKHLRGRDFKPCTDGGTAPMCSTEGVCILGLAYRC
jgi:hypothetical protein